MKRYLKTALVLFILSAVLLLVFPQVCLAEDEVDKSEYSQRLGEYDLSSFEILDDDTRNLLDELGISDFDYDSITSLSFEKLLSIISKSAAQKIRAPLQAGVTLVCLIILSSLVKSFGTSGVLQSGGAYSTVSNLVIAIYLTSSIGDVLSLAASSIRLCSDFTYAFFPAFCILCAASGSVVTSLSLNASLLMLSQLLNFISSGVFLPVTNCFAAISVCASIRKDLNLSSLVAAFKKVITKSISALSALFVSYLSFKTAVASRADAIGLRSVRFAINTVVPVIGSSISEGLLSIQSYSSLIKTSVGIVGIIAICAVFMPAIISTAVWRLVLSCAEVCSKIFFNGDSAGVIQAFNSVLLIVNVLLILCMVTTIISLGILVAVKGGA